MIKMTVGSKDQLDLKPKSIIEANSISDDLLCDGDFELLNDYEESYEAYQQLKRAKSFEDLELKLEQFELVSDMDLLSESEMDLVDDYYEVRNINYIRQYYAPVSRFNLSSLQGPKFSVLSTDKLDFVSILDCWSIARFHNLTQDVYRNTKNILMNIHIECLLATLMLENSKNIFCTLRHINQSFLNIEYFCRCINHISIIICLSVLF
eukprot:NODE_90_length_21577_cov_0.697691.p12 type:complete len:208 gc:universal NODE_90_length_21577_cov_0.697691:20922-21545(+)